MRISIALQLMEKNVGRGWEGRILATRTWKHKRLRSNNAQGF
jgi:hypothetical protein